jgi:cytochrome P450
MCSVCPCCTAATLLGKDNLLVVKDSARHLKLRTLLQPAFSADAIRTFLPAIEALVARCA